MNLKILNIEEISEIYNTHMVNDFPRAELKPLSHIVNTTEKGLCFSVGMYENIEDEGENSLLGYAVFILPDGYKYGLLDYLAITGKNRGKGYGHVFFSMVKEFFSSHFPFIEGIFIECESVESAEDTRVADVRMRRINFYEDCGCVKTRLGSKLFGVEYSILMLPVAESTGNKTICDIINGDVKTGDVITSDVKTDCNKADENIVENCHKCGDTASLRICRSDLDFIYKRMFKPHHYKEQVSLWEKLDEVTLSMSARKLAPYLIGKLLCRNIDGNIIKYRITETECYCGEEDTACHAHKGKTERTKVLYEKGGTSYVYLCYGIHSLFNVVSGVSGHPEAVLIRGVEGFDGPGKLTKAMKIDKSLNGIDMTLSDELWIEDDGVKCKYRRDKRVGIDYATPKYRDILWRYICI